MGIDSLTMIFFHSTLPLPPEAIVHLVAKGRCTHVLKFIDTMCWMFAVYGLSTGTQMWLIFDARLTERVKAKWEKN